jgi:hypothetical protein
MPRTISDGIIRAVYEEFVVVVARDIHVTLHSGRGVCGLTRMSPVLPCAAAGPRLYRAGDDRAAPIDVSR